MRRVHGHIRGYTRLALDLRSQESATGLCLIILASGLAASLVTRSDDVAVGVTPVAVAVAVALLPRLRALEIILLAVALHLVAIVANPDDAGTRDLDIIITGGSAILGLLGARPAGWLIRPMADTGAGAGGFAQRVTVSGARPTSAVLSLPEMRVAGEPGSDRFPARFGEAGLSLRQQEVVELVLRGLTARQIGSRLFISERTVETHLANVYERLGVHSRLELLHSLSEAAIA